MLHAHGIMYIVQSLMLLLIHRELYISMDFLREKNDDTLWEGRKMAIPIMANRRGGGGH